MGEYWRLEPTECLDCKLRSSYPCAGAQGVRRAEFPLRTLCSQRSLADSLTALLHGETTVSPNPFADPPLLPSPKKERKKGGIIKWEKRSTPEKLRREKKNPPRDRGGFLSAKLRRNNQPNQRAVCGGTTFMTFCFCMSIC